MPPGPELDDDREPDDVDRFAEWLADATREMVGAMEAVMDPGAMARPAAGERDEGNDEVEAVDAESYETDDVEADEADEADEAVEIEADEEEAEYLEAHEEAEAEEEPPEPIGPSVADFVIGALDGTLRTIARRPVRVRGRTSPLSAVQGKLDVLVIEVRELPITGLLVDRVVIHAENIRVQPGLPPRLKAGPVGFKGTVSQKAVDRWTRAAHLPVRLKLTPSGVVAKTTVIGGVSMEVTAELAARGPFIRLKPKSASMMGVRSPIMPTLPGYLPLPPLPAGAKLKKVEHGDGEVTVWFDAGEIDEPITPALATRLTRRFLLPVPRFG